MGGTRRGHGGTEAAAQHAQIGVEAAWTGLAERRTRDGEGGAGGVGPHRSATCSDRAAVRRLIGAQPGARTTSRLELYGKEAAPCGWLASVEGRTLARGGSGAVRKR
jgi:hypothetical protein